MCQNWCTNSCGVPVQHSGDESQVIVLDPDRGPPARGLFLGRPGKPAIDRDVGFPGLGLEAEVVELKVAERPERAVGDVQVVLFDLLFRERDPAKQKRRVVGRDQDPAVGVGYLEISGAASPGDPGPAGRDHRRLQGGGDSPRGAYRDRPPIRAHAGAQWARDCSAG